VKTIESALKNLAAACLMLNNKYYLNNGFSFFLHDLHSQSLDIAVAEEGVEAEVGVLAVELEL